MIWTDASQAISHVLAVFGIGQQDKASGATIVTITVRDEGT